MDIVLEDKSESSRKRNGEVGERLFQIEGAACAKAWKKEEHGGLEEVREGLGGRDAAGGREPSHRNAEGLGALEAMLRMQCLLVCKCINGFTVFMFTFSQENSRAERMYLLFQHLYCH